MSSPAKTLVNNACPLPRFRIDNSLTYIWTVYLCALYKSRMFLLILHSDTIFIGLHISSFVNTVMSLLQLKLYYCTQYTSYCPYFLRYVSFWDFAYVCIQSYFLRLLLIIHFMVHDLKCVHEVAVCRLQVVTSSVLCQRQKKYILHLFMYVCVCVCVCVYIYIEREREREREKLASLCGMFTHLPPMCRYKLSDSTVSFTCHSSCAEVRIFSLDCVTEILLSLKVMVPQLCFIGILGPTQVFQEIHCFNCALQGVGTAIVLMKPPPIG